MFGADFKFERLANKEAHELPWMVEMAIETVVTTVPEFDGKIERAVEVFPNLTGPAMLAMFQSVIENPLYYFMLVRDEKAAPAAHSIFSLKTDLSGIRYGSFYTRYVLSEYRRKGVASKMLEIAESWFSKEKAEYLSAQTHVSNKALQELYKAHGYLILGVKAESKIPMLEMQKRL